MQPHQIKKIIKKRNRGFIKLIYDYKTQIAHTVYTKEELQQMAYDISPGQKESLQDVYQSLNSRFNSFILSTSKVFSQVMNHGATKVLTKSGNVVQFRTPTYKMEVQELVKNNLRLVQNVTNEQRKKTLEIISAGVKNGLPTKVIAQQIGQELPGFTSMKAKLIAETEISRSHANAQFIVMRDNGIKKYRWLTAQDKEVCEHCAAFANKSFPMTEDSPKPVRDTHPRCRCVIVADLP